MLQAGEDALQFAVAAVGDLVEIVHDLVDIDRHQGAAGPDEGHGQGAAVPQGLLQFGHGFQGIGVGGQEFAEAAVPGGEQALQLPPDGGGVGVGVGRRNRRKAVRSRSTIVMAKKKRAAAGKDFLPQPACQVCSERNQ